jgi:hypothetical protein
VTQQQEKTTSKPIELSALPPEREEIIIRHKAEPQGELFYLARLDDLGTETWKEVSAKAVEMQKLYDRKEQLNKTQRSKLTGLLNTLASSVILGVSPKLVQAMDDYSKWLAATAFLAAANERMDRLPAFMLTSSEGTS